MRFLLLAVIFTAVLIAMFYLLDPSEGGITRRAAITPHERAALSHLPRP